ncbi:1647_t:CDS:2 [Paraglomus brasilianum]|uniref:1647_t:CDS:1 n=1 Tax=Paraglomus brasilianum TaxID=144538 RepID=A0A9N8VNV7_9GLOM|nr:1647_t:CDS:2 [Paraglomus brasilianum]
MSSDYCRRQKTSKNTLTRARTCPSIRKKIPPRKQSFDSCDLRGPCRYESSLVLLTKKFVRMLRNSLDGVLDLNNAVVELNVKKRRIYDITNVLEGIGLIEKNSKNHVRWKGAISSSTSSSFKRRIEDLKKRNADLETQCQNIAESRDEIDADIKKMFESEETNRLAVLYRSDIQNLTHLESDDDLIVVNWHHDSLIHIGKSIEDDQSNRCTHKLSIKHPDNPSININPLPPLYPNHHFSNGLSRLNLCPAGLQSRQLHNTGLPVNAINDRVLHSQESTLDYSYAYIAQAPTPISPNSCEFNNHSDDNRFDNCQDHQKDRNE